VGHPPLPTVCKLLYYVDHQQIRKDSMLIGRQSADVGVDNAEITHVSTAQSQ